MTDIPRACGGCNACCKPFAIPEIGKLTATWCTHCVRGVGCAIYETRPGACRMFACAWLKGVGEGGDRPDRVGFIMNQTGVQVFDRTIEILELLEIDPGSLESPRAKQIVDHVARGPYVVIQRRQVSETEFQPEVVCGRGFLNDAERAEMHRQLQQ